MSGPRKKRKLELNDEDVPQDFTGLSSVYVFSGASGFTIDELYSLQSGRDLNLAIIDNHFTFHQHHYHPPPNALTVITTTVVTCACLILGLF
ncbi:hypothetical protein MD484_g5284, partial [Candolleomyces efflorescens]